MKQIQTQNASQNQTETSKIQTFQSVPVAQRFLQENKTQNNSKLSSAQRSPQSDKKQQYRDFIRQIGEQNFQSNIQPKQQNISQYQPQLDHSNVMKEKTNNMVKSKKQVEILDQQNAAKEHQSQNQDPSQSNLLQKKFDQLYNTAPLNSIPESWDQESKASATHETYSATKGNYSRDSTENVDLIQSSNKKHRKTTTASITKDSAKKLAQNNSQQSIKSMGSECLNKTKQEEKKERNEAIKSRLKQLYLNYSDYSMDSGEVFITYTNFLKVMKDSQIIDDKVNQNSISIIISKECNATTNMIKHITFEQFLNAILRISEAKYEELFKKHPKSALKELLKRNILPLLKRIETAVEKQSDEFQYSLYTVSELTLRLIVYNEDTQVIFTDILPLIKLLYNQYFEQEINQSKGKLNELKKLSLRSVMNFTREFEISPYLVHQKASFLIWYSVANSTSNNELSNNPEIKNIIQNAHNHGKQFTLGHFIIFIYRLSVIYFNHSQEKPQDFNLIKKLLYFLRKLENSDGFKKFLNKLNRTYTDTLTFLPSKDLLTQILKAEGVDDLVLTNPEEMAYVTKEAMLSRIVDQHLFVKNFLEQKSENNCFDNERDEYLMNSEDELKKLFEIYCSFGEPMNTKYLKSSKLYKLFKEVGLLKGQSRLPGGCEGARQITTQDMDLIFKQVCAKSFNMGGAFDQFASCMTFTGSQDQSQLSGFLQFQSQMQLNRTRGPMNNVSQFSQIGKTATFDKQSHLIDKNGSNAGRIDYQQFRKVLEMVSTKVYNQLTGQACYVELLKNIILPQLKHINDKRCIHNQNISNLLVKLDNQDMINMLTILHKAMIDIYKMYSDSKGYMNFQQYINFCSDYDIFPHMATKAALYRIYHSLSFMNEVLSNGGSNFPKQSTMKSMTSMNSKMSGMSRIGSPGRIVQNEYIDEHLFVESLALIALYDENQEVMSPSKKQFIQDDQEGDRNNGFSPNEMNLDEDDCNENTPVEKVLQLVEKMANSEGVFKRIRKGDISNSIKCNMMDKKDILDLFRVKYAWYFKLRYHDQTLKKKNFDDIMEMSSMMTEGSQIEL